MKVLGINTASSYTVVVLVEKGIVASRFWRSNNDEASKLLPVVDELLREAGWNFADIESVYVVSGPGSFTGLRVGVTVANTIAYLTGAKLFGIRTLEYWNLLYPDMPVAIFAGKGGVFLDSKLVNLPDVAETSEAFAGVDEVVGDVSDEQKEVLEGRGVAVLSPSGEWDQDFVKVIEKFSGDEVKIVEPLYIKSPNITQAK